MDLFEQLRREHEFGIGTIAGVAAKFGVHRRLVRQALASALPPPHRYPPRVKPKLGVVAAFIDTVLDEDRRAPRKQRHTARRLYRRILTECPDATVAESTVRHHVRERKHQMGLRRRETLVPQSYGWAQEAQVDWYEAWVDLGDERTKVQVFAMRAMASGAAFHRAYRHRLIARHERCHSRRQHVLDLEHYRDVLSQKPGAFAGPKPLAQWRAAGRWPTCYDELWAQLSKRHGKQNGTRAMIAVLALGQEFGHDRLRAAVAATLSHGACDVAAVRYLLTEASLHKAHPETIDVGALARYDRPLPDLADYDMLLSAPCAGTA